MEILSIPDTVNVKFTSAPQKQNLGFSKFLINRDSYSRISSGLSPVDAIAPPPIVRRNLTAPRTLTRKRRRTRRRSLTGGSDSDDGGDGDVGGENGFFGDDGPFGGSGSGGSGGGRGWSFGGGGGSNWDDDEDEELASADPAFDFVYEVISWIVLSNCVHFAFKKVVNGVNNGDDSSSSSSREKVVAPVC